tara:strand:- start:10256 stop:12088 length:1833 start_codon:yes stop_codon:yes gene_type:complete
MKMAKEFQYSLEPYFIKGLRPDTIGVGQGQLTTQDSKAKDKFLETAEGCIVGDTGIIPILPPIDHNFSSQWLTLQGIEYNWPFGQGLQVGEQLHYISDTKIYKIDFGDGKSGNNSATVIPCFNYLDGTTPSDIRTGTNANFTFAYFNEKTWFAFNGVSILMQHNLGEVHNGYTSTKGKYLTINGQEVPEDFTINTGCAHRGRLITAGFTRGRHKLWEAHLDAWQDLNLPDSAWTDGAESDCFAGDTIAWSSIGGGDALWQFYPELALTSSTDRVIAYDENHSVGNAYMFNKDIENMSGYMKLPYGEPILSTVPIGKNILVQTRHHTCMLTLQSKPISTYGFKHIADVGIASRTAVDVKNDKEAIFLANDGALHSVNEKGDIKRIGYSGWFRPGLVDLPIGGYSQVTDALKVHTVFYDGTWNCWFISTEDETFIYTENGFTQINNRMTGRIMYPEGLRFGGSNYAGPVWNYIYFSPDVNTDTAGVKCITEGFEMNPKGIKRITWVNVVGYKGSGNTDPEPDEITVYYKVRAMGSNNIDGATTGYSSSVWRKKTLTIPDTGACYFGVEGYVFKVEFSGKGTNASVATHLYNFPASIEVRWQLSDKRFVRGAY